MNGQYEPSSEERHHAMLIPQTPTYESMRWILILLKGIRAEGSYEEYQLRTMRHILASHLDLDGLPQPIASQFDRASMTHERMLSLLSEGLFDIVTDDEEGESNRLQAMRIIGMQLGQQTPDPRFA
jgi:hypothetical protein